MTTRPSPVDSMAGTRDALLELANAVIGALETITGAPARGDDHRAALFRQLWAMRAEQAPDGRRARHRAQAWAGIVAGHAVEYLAIASTVDPGARLPGGDTRLIDALVDIRKVADAMGDRMRGL